MSSLSPKSPDQSEKSKKYDRQLRLWGDHGQAALEYAHVCLINATGLGSEILKSLVLAGVGAFTIVDGEKISDEDVGVNFFLDPDSIGQPRGEITTQLLLELNPDVRGDAIDESLDKLLTNNPDFFNNFSVIVATRLSEKEIITLSKKLWEADIPLIVCQSIGFIGSGRLQVQEHTVVESHPENQNPDLRLDCPFPSLKEYFDQIDLEAMEFKDHAHTPFVVILYKYLEKWKKLHNSSKGPSNFKEKASLRELIKSGIHRDEQGNPLAEENFEEAIRAVNYAISTSEIPQSIKDILNDGSCINLTGKSKPFWIIAKAIKDFVENEGNGYLPLRGTLPDMTADTAKYVAIQQLYRDQAAKDAEIVFRRVQQLLRQLNQPDDTITENEVRQFCKHASSISVIRGSSIADEYTFRNISQKIVTDLESPHNLMVYYVMLRGLDRFYSEYNTYPGVYNDQVEPDIVKMKACISRLISEWGCSSFSKDDFVHEICRYGGAELHSVSAFLGGAVSHEIIKLITKQYKPINNTFIYDAISAETATFTF
ncbi:unnamed protein product [Bemisia tabaci]|uniref:NEDD8-activating enzyme E1 regulatory subunit n=1 Tax=Bemisia tabaci TaxID=7038 RepID=A0A9P0EZ64_BEMTA|nr:unnamed protein product [Bemisia tabaci]